MARVEVNPIIEVIRGAIGEQLVLKRDKAGRIILSRKPRFGPDREFSPAQRAHQDRFREAAAYAKRAAREQAVYADLAEGGGRSAYNVALADWFHPPVVHQIDLDGYTGRAAERLRARVTDDVRVVRVRVTVRAAGDGVVVEEGEARPERAGGEWYAYESGVDCPVGEVVVAVTAEDLAGHEAVLEGRLLTG